MLRKKQFVEVRELSLADLMEGDVVVRVSHSTVNYKDGLAITGKPPVVRRWPMIPGIDFAGEVVSSENPELQARRRGDPERLGRRARRITAPMRDGARQGRLAGQDADGILSRRGDGDRHRRLHRDALRDGARAPRHRARAARSW